MFGLPNLSQAGLELAMAEAMVVAVAAVAVVAHKFCQCDMAWRRLPRARGSGI
jgi:hypothetical protein